MEPLSNSTTGSTLPDRAALASRIRAAPFHQWLSMELTEADRNVVVITIGWRDEMISQVEPPIMHGGIIASLIDVAGLYALLAAGANVRNTTYLHVDYHRGVSPGPLHVRGRPIRIGGAQSVAEAMVYDAQNRLLASGRGGYMSPHRD